jgi:hypothetical protein
MPSISRLYHHIVGTKPPSDTTAKSTSGLRTFGSSQKTGKFRKGGGLHSLAKYMTPSGAGMTTLGSKSGHDHEDEFELRKHVASTATASVDVPMACSQTGDFESGGRGVASNPNSTQNNILKTSKVEQTYAWRPEDK